MEFDVLVVGSINVDHVIRSAHLPGPGETVTGGVFEEHGGGKGANQAVSAARLGARVGLIAAVGDDHAGSRALSELTMEGVDVTCVVVLPSAATGVALIVVDASGENQIAVASGANDHLGAMHVESALTSVQLSDNGVLLVGFEVGDAAVEAAVLWATEGGHTAVLDPAPARPLTPVMVACAPIVKPNALEVKQLTGESDPGTAASALSLLVGSPVIVTLGADGALVADGGTVMRWDPPLVTPIDSTGAGDTFTGALAVGLTKGLTLTEAVQYAQAAAAMSIESEGARSGMPTSSELNDFLTASR